VIDDFADAARCHFHFAARHAAAGCRRLAAAAAADDATICFAVRRRLFDAFSAADERSVFAEAFAVAPPPALAAALYFRAERPRRFLRQPPDFRLLLIRSRPDVAQMPHFAAAAGYFHFH